MCGELHDWQVDMLVSICDDTLTFCERSTNFNFVVYKAKFNRCVHYWKKIMIIKGLWKQTKSCWLIIVVLVQVNIAIWNCKNKKQYILIITLVDFYYWYCYLISFVCHFVVPSYYWGVVVYIIRCSAEVVLDLYWCDESTSNHQLPLSSISLVGKIIYLDW